MKKILINFLYWGSKNSGIYRYSYNLLQNLEKLSNDDIYVVTNHNLNFINLKLIKIKTFMLKLPHFIQTQFIIKKLLKNLKPDAIFNPFHVGYFFNLSIPQISTIHDLIHLTVYRRKIQTFIYHKFFLKRLINNSKIIITVSESSKKDLVNILRINEKKIKVVYESFDPIFRKINTKKENFYLVVNPSYTYKNINSIINLWQKFNIKDLIVIAGCNEHSKQYFNYLKNLVKKLKLENKVKFLGQISDEELVELYNKAKALISASLKEGFDLPPLEALACGTPVILSDIPVHREIYDDIGIFFDLNDDKSFLEALNKLENLNFEEFEKKRLEFLRKFSWQKTAEEVYKIIKECIEG